MSLHKKPLTPIEEAGLRAHGLDIGTPSQLSDAFRLGVAFGLAAEHKIVGWTNDKGDMTTDRVRAEKWETYGWQVTPLLVQSSDLLMVNNNLSQTTMEIDY